jgi:hypothetical protein
MPESQNRQRDANNRSSQLNDPSATQRQAQGNTNGTEENEGNSNELFSGAHRFDAGTGHRYMVPGTRLAHARSAVQPRSITDPVPAVRDAEQSCRVATNGE